MVEEKNSVNLWHLAIAFIFFSSWMLSSDRVQTICEKEKKKENKISHWQMLYVALKRSALVSNEVAFIHIVSHHSFYRGLCDRNTVAGTAFKLCVCTIHSTVTACISFVFCVWLPLSDFLSVSVILCVFVCAYNIFYWPCLLLPLPQWIVMFHGHSFLWIIVAQIWNGFATIMHDRWFC